MKNNRVNEAAVKRTVLNAVRKIPRSFWWSNPVSLYGMAGRPDIEGVADGNYIGIECKSLEAFKKPFRGQTPPQRKYEEQVMKAGGVYILACGINEVSKVLGDLGYDISE